MRTEPPSKGPIARPRPVERARGIDEVDRGIIEALQRNGREPFRRIAADIGVSEATVRARYGAAPRSRHPPGDGGDEPARARLRGEAMVGVRDSGPPERVADELARWPEAEYVVVTPASSTSSSSSSAPTAGICST